MDTLVFLQHYWWFLIALLGAVLVFLLFVQGGQALFYTLGRTEAERTALLASLDHKWELTFTTLVVFGGAFFASFPLFYAVSFGGACYVWLALLLLFVMQAAAFGFRGREGSLYGRRTYDAVLAVGGTGSPFLLGTALGTLFTGAPFVVNRFGMARTDGDLFIARWTSPWHGLEALADYRNAALGLALVFLSRLLACHYFLSAVTDPALRERARRRSLPAAALFLAAFGLFFAGVASAAGYGADPATGTVSLVEGKLLLNLRQMPLVAVLAAGGVAALAWGVAAGARGSRRALWASGAGSVATVLALLLAAGWNDTAYYPSLSDMQSSLTIRNSSSSRFTLRVMAVVSLLLPVVAGYVAYAWRAVARPPRPHDAA